VNSTIAESIALRQFTDHLRSSGFSLKVKDGPTIPIPGFMRRHLLAHTAGVIDQRYIDETREPAALVGRRLIVTSEEVTMLAGLVETLGRELSYVAGPYFAGVGLPPIRGPFVPG
jgi:hypothetical protein